MSENERLQFEKLDTNTHRGSLKVFDDLINNTITNTTI